MKLTKKLLKEYRGKAIEAGACSRAIEVIDLVLAGKMTLKQFKGLEEFPMWCLWYAKRVIRGPWPEAEDIIRTDPWFAYNYARNALKLNSEDDGAWVGTEPTSTTSASTTK